MVMVDVAGRYGTDKLGHGYLPHYQRHVGTPRTILEIGIFQGASLRMWQEAYPDARVMGVDIDPRFMHDDVECHLGDAADPATYDGWLPDQIDLIVDDGSHQASDVIRTIDLLWRRVAPGGWYVIEDLACAFEPAFGGDYNGGPVMQLVRDFALRAVTGRDEVHLYEEIAFFRRTT